MLGGPVCIDVKPICNQPPEITNCQTSDVVMQWDEQYGYQYTYTDPDGPDPPYTWAVISGPGQITQDGYYTNNPDCQEVGSHTVSVELCDGAGGCDTCTFTKTVLNSPPTISGDCDEYFVIGTNTVNPGLAQFFVADPNVGDVHTFYLCSITPNDGNVIVTVNQDGSVECWGADRR